MKTQLIQSPLHLPASKAPRSEGVHLSRLIGSIARLNGVLKNDIAESFSLVEVQEGQQAWWDALGPADKLRISIGLAWESYYIPTLEAVVDHPGELCVEGIYMTPDGESIDAILVDGVYVHTAALHEVKATYKSIKTVGDLSTQWMWLAQMRAYCKGMDTRRAYLHVLFLCGDYTFPITPVLKVWQIDFTQAEIDDNWDVMLTHMRHQQLQDHENQMRDTDGATR